MIESLRLKAKYNQWMNASLFKKCSALQDYVLKQDSGAFFKSIHGTLNHLLLTDLMWLSRITSTKNISSSASSLDAILYDDFGDLWASRKETDGMLIDFVDGLDNSDLVKDVTYVSLQAGTEKVVRLDLILIHLFNHQTHHRGQITTLLSQQGVDAGTTDLLFMPNAASILSE